MYGMTVKIGSAKIFVMCTPTTPMSEILRQAADQMYRAEQEQANASPQAVAYRHAVKAAMR